MIHERLLRGLEEISQAGLDLLKDPVWIEGIIREIGVAAGPWVDPGSDRMHSLNAGGIMQSSRELAELLLLLSSYPIRTAVDIGTFNGWSIACMTAYLHRWNPCLQVVTVDPYPVGTPEERSALARMLPLTFRIGTSNELRGQRFDFCFIDGDHRYEAVRFDYECVGRSARICAFHDVTPTGSVISGVPRFWEELRAAPGEWATFYEIRHARPGRPCLGIGIRIRP
jgi:predicted O-methyltransferase YrrM